jgi:hypothetical protein
LRDEREWGGNLGIILGYLCWDIGSVKRPMRLLRIDRVKLFYTIPAKMLSLEGLEPELVSEVA